MSWFQKWQNIQLVTEWQELRCVDVYIHIVPKLHFLFLLGVLNNMDRNANPCTDFYQYACGGWEKRNFIEDSEVSVFPFLEVQSENKRQLKVLLENKDIKLNYSSVSTSVQFPYKVC